MWPRRRHLALLQQPEDHGREIGSHLIGGLHHQRDLAVRQVKLHRLARDDARVGVNLKVALKVAGTDIYDGIGDVGRGAPGRRPKEGVGRI